jgi:hypothetical protein
MGRDVTTDENRLNARWRGDIAARDRRPGVIFHSDPRLSAHQRRLR